MRYRDMINLTMRHKQRHDRTQQGKMTLVQVVFMWCFASIFQSIISTLSNWTEKYTTIFNSTLS